MIKVFIVDDDKLVRKGLISAMPWAQFDMEVVGEANNGKKALELLESTEVDLLVTDLAMPVMSGIELIREVRKRYPRMFFVVLTLHQDFEYIQEALRLGAMDYIAKVQLEKEHFEDVLGRVHARIMREMRKTPAPIGDSKAGYHTDDVWVFLCDAEQPDAEWLTALLPGIHELALNAWIWSADEGDGLDSPDMQMEQMVADKPGWNVMKLRGVAGQPPTRVHHRLRLYARHDYFYEPVPPGQGYVRSLEQLRELPPCVTKEQFDALTRQLLSLEWVHVDASFGRLTEAFKRQRCSAWQLMQAWTALQSQWQRTYGDLTGQSEPLPDRFHRWQEAENWLLSLRESVADMALRTAYSHEVAASVLQAARIIREELDSPLYARDVAKRVGMSRSYFSQCFKEITGKSFNEFLRRSRMEKAKELLVHTAFSIPVIAERTGYADEKYFSRVFREYIGVLPSEYRQAAQAVAQPAEKHVRRGQTTGETNV